MVRWWDHRVDGRTTSGLFLRVRAALAFLVLMTAATGEARADAIDREMLVQAPVILRYLKDHRYENVGVLKFRVKRESGPASDRAGVMNIDLASRLEVALVLTSDVNAPVGIIREASRVAERLPSANHLTAEGRRALFATTYPLAWGDRSVKPDAFVTGVAELGADLRQLKVTVYAFGKEGGPLEKVCQFASRADAASLAKAGVSFISTGVRGIGRVDPAQAALQGPNPLQTGTGPIALEVYFDGKAIPLQFRNGDAWVPEPQVGQKVEFGIRRFAKGDETYAIVLRVNGENTIFKERLDPIRCHKWVVGPENPWFMISGYHTGLTTAEQFKVLSDVESRSNAINYGPEVGVIDLFVFASRGEDEPPPAPEPVALDKSKPKDAPATLLADEPDEEDLEAMTRAALPSTRPATLDALKAQLQKMGEKLLAGGRTRGLVVGGEKVRVGMRRIEFRIDPQPMMHATIRYYRPSPRPAL